MKYLLVVLLSLSSTLFATENKGFIEFFGSVSANQFSVTDVSIELFKNGLPETSLCTKNGGDFDIRFEKNNLYEVKVSKKGFFSQKFEVDTKGVEVEEGLFTCKFSIDLVPFIEGVDAHIFSLPVCTIRYNPRMDEFERIIDKQTMIKIKHFFEDYEQVKEKCYKKYVTLADSAVLNNNFNLAKELYLNAIGLETNNDYADIRLDMVEKMIAKEIRIQILYDNAIANADLYMKMKEYKKALKDYRKALSLKEDTYPKQQIDLINNIR